MSPGVSRRRSARPAQGEALRERVRRVHAAHRGRALRGVHAFAKMHDTFCGVLLRRERRRALAPPPSFSGGSRRRSSSDERAACHASRRRGTVRLEPRAPTASAASRPRARPSRRSANRANRRPAPCATRRVVSVRAHARVPREAHRDCSATESSRTPATGSNRRIATKDVRRVDGFADAVIRPRRSDERRRVLTGVIVTRAATCSPGGVRSFSLVVAGEDTSHASRRGTRGSASGHRRRAPPPKGRKSTLRVAASTARRSPRVDGIGGEIERRIWSRSGSGT